MLCVRAVIWTFHFVGLASSGFVQAVPLQKRTMSRLLGTQLLGHCTTWQIKRCPFWV
uniref:Uncharacterized protein n=1 Tax=Anguilla anguilla TaxID=7936 RepID=A0A0E9W1K4_ANGAN